MSNQGTASKYENAVWGKHTWKDVENQTRETFFSIHSLSPPKSLDVVYWNYTQNLAITNNGRECKKRNIYLWIYILCGLPRWLSGKDPPANARVSGDMGSIPELEDPLEKEMTTHSSIFAWEIPRTEEPGELQSMGSQESDMTERLSTHTHTN